MQVQIDKTKEEIQEKKRQMRLLEQRINSADIPQLIANPQEMSQVRGGFLLMVTLISSALVKTGNYSFNTILCCFCHPLGCG